MTNITETSRFDRERRVNGGPKVRHKQNIWKNQRETEFFRENKQREEAQESKCVQFEEMAEDWGTKWRTDCGGFRQGGPCSWCPPRFTAPSVCQGEQSNHADSCTLEAVGAKERREETFVSCLVPSVLWFRFSAACMNISSYFWAVVFLLFVSRTTNETKALIDPSTTLTRFKYLIYF